MCESALKGMKEICCIGEQNMRTSSSNSWGQLLLGASQVIFGSHFVLSVLSTTEKAAAGADSEPIRLWARCSP